MNLQDPTLNPVATETPPEVTIEMGGVPVTAKELVRQTYESLIGDAFVKGDMLRDTIKRTVAASTHNADLLEALDEGADFRIAFRKKSETDWTRVRYTDEASLQNCAMEEVATRQAGVLKNLADVLGVDEFTISNI